MKESDVRKDAFAMPLTSPAFPLGPYRFIDREYLIITYRTDPEKLRAVVLEPLRVGEPLVKYEFIRMPDSTAFGAYTANHRLMRAPTARRSTGASAPMRRMAGATSKVLRRAMRRHTVRGGRPWPIR